MSIDGKVLELQEKANEMAKYYYMGFGDNLAIIANNASHYLKNPKGKDEISYNLLQGIENWYSKIPFDSLDAKEYHMLFTVREMLPILRNAMDDVFKNKKDKFSLIRLERLTGSISDIGRLYKTKLLKLLKEIRSFPEAKDFTVEVYHYECRLIKI